MLMSIQHGSQLKIRSAIILNQMLKNKNYFDSYDPAELEQVLKHNKK